MLSTLLVLWCLPRGRLLGLWFLVARARIIRVRKRIDQSLASDLGQLLEHLADYLPGLVVRHHAPDPRELVGGEERTRDAPRLLRRLNVPGLVRRGRLELDAPFVRSAMQPSLDLDGGAQKDGRHQEQQQKPAELHSLLTSVSHSRAMCGVRIKFPVRETRD